MQYAVVVVVGEEIMRFEVSGAWYHHATAIGRLVELGLRFAPPQVVREKVQEIVNALAPPVNWAVQGAGVVVWRGSRRFVIGREG